MLSTSLLTVFPLLVLGHPGWGNGGWGNNGHSIKHVIAISVDGMHGSDLTKWTTLRPESNISLLLQHGLQYNNAFTSAPSDSFPGTLAQFTGATPRTTGIWYDDTWNRDFYAPSSGCVGAPGAEVVYDETKDYNSTELFSGGIDPSNLPQKVVDGVCTDIYPHAALRVNTVWELVTASGGETAYADKHPAYDVVRGPSGSGLTLGYFPEIAAVPNTVAAVIDYDKLHVDAWLQWLDVATPPNTTIFNGPLTKVPTLFGGNFQSLNVAQKTVGYENDTANSFSPAIIEVMEFVDTSIGAIVNKLKQLDLYDETLIIVASKHGQAPIERSLFSEVDPDLITNLTGVPVAFQTSDDIALIFLNDTSDTNQAAANLEANAAAGHIRAVIYGSNLTQSGFGNPLVDPAVPDIIVQPDLGVIYTTSTKKVAEHGGISSDDRGVTCFLSNPNLRPASFSDRVYTTQIAPTILQALGLSPKNLQGAQLEGTAVLPGFPGYDGPWPNSGGPWGPWSSSSSSSWPRR